MFDSTLRCSRCGRPDNLCLACPDDDPDRPVVHDDIRCIFCLIDCGDLGVCILCDVPVPIDVEVCEECSREEVNA